MKMNYRLHIFITTFLSIIFITSCSKEKETYWAYNILAVDAFDGSPIAEEEIQMEFYLAGNIFFGSDEGRTNDAGMLQLESVVSVDSLENHFLETPSLRSQFHAFPTPKDENRFAYFSQNNTFETHSLFKVDIEPETEIKMYVSPLTKLSIIVKDPDMNHDISVCEVTFKIPLYDTPGFREDWSIFVLKELFLDSPFVFDVPQNQEIEIEWTIFEYDESDPELKGGVLNSESKMYTFTSNNEELIITR